MRTLLLRRLSTLLSQESCLSSPWPSVTTYSSSIQLPQPQSGELPLLTLAFGRLLPSLLTLSSAQARYGLAPSSSSAPSPCSSSMSSSSSSSSLISTRSRSFLSTFSEQASTCISANLL
ncbi:hypothetical protein GUITHDRAFT_152335, partial [Guillardia theta CCMP2712]